MSFLIDQTSFLCWLVVTESVILLTSLSDTLLLKFWKMYFHFCFRLIWRLEGSYKYAFCKASCPKLLGIKAKFYCNYFRKSLDHYHTFHALKFSVYKAEKFLGEE